MAEKRSRGVSEGFLEASRGHLWVLLDLPEALQNSQEIPVGAPVTPLGGSAGPKDQLLFSKEVSLGFLQLLQNSLFYYHFSLLHGLPGPGGQPERPLGPAGLALGGGSGLCPAFHGRSAGLRPGSVAPLSSSFSALRRLWELRGLSS